jgi:hypothetical protein
VDIINEQPELSVFASLLQKTSYDKVLSASQSYTVFAPDNNALAGVDVNNMDEVEALKIIKNHVARFTQSASGNPNKIIYMVNLKMIRFGNSGGDYSIGGSKLAKLNLYADNGILHILDSQIPLLDNIWEYMEKPGFESIRDYMYPFTVNEFNPYSSVQIDINLEGLPVYDSVFYENNILWNTYRGSVGIGDINNEDSLYTMIMPNNRAWEDAYLKAFPYFAMRDEIVNKDSIQDVNTKYAIIENLVFRGKVDTTQFSSPDDSLITTRMNVIYDPARLFRGTTKVAVSNGEICVMNNEFTLDPTDAWHREIRVEAEGSYGRENSTDCQIFTRSAMDHPELSNFRYLEVLSSSTGARPYVQFEIPNTLAGLYNVYCIFVPPSVANSTAQDSTKIRCTFYEKREDVWVNIRSGGVVGGSFVPVPTQEVKSSNGMSKILLSADGQPWRFANANYMAEESTIRVRIACAISAQDYNRGWTNNYRIDCLVLEPVKED